MKTHCHAFGHAVHAYSKMDKKVWLPKKPATRDVPVQIADVKKIVARVVEPGSDQIVGTVTRPSKVPSDVFDKSSSPPKQAFHKPLISKLGSNSFEVL
ncbi:hypothetical protein SLA2020_267470 [Shorea laevis]